ncbi:Ig-like domain-containing protein, partial [Robinsoniella sp. RHS]|uniref:Ig-like domain-containing protein n=1 Tax=Robinsoniella sp. RHS TaxID=1504536 RepID=UPI00064A2EF2
ISSWADTGTTTDEGERHAGEATSLIPWSWDIKTGDKLDINGGAKLYHWNTTGNPTTWELTDEFKNVPSFDLYETTQQGKVKIGTISNDGGTITINSKKNTPYVLYPSTSTHVLEAAGNWGEGSPAKDFAFNAEKFADEGGVWEKTGDASIEVVPGKVNYDISKEMSENRWDRYAQFKTEGGTLSQEMTDLKPGQDYTVGVWTETQNGRKASIEVTIGDQTYTNFVTGKDGVHRSSFKYVGTRWQRMDVEFTVPEGVTTAQIKLTAEKGDGVVNFDDVKVWQHTTTENDVNNSDYVLYEDFENTYEGWGPLEYGGGSRKIHIASDRSNANDNNEIVKPGEDKVGPVMTWVLDGENSLKLNENEVGRYVVTNESSLKLQPNTSYDLTFDYTLEDGCDYVVYVKPVSQGAEGKLAFKDHENATEVKLKHTPTSGDKKTKSTFNGTFTTGDAEDYQIYFYEKVILKPTDSNPTSAYALILDNVGVKYNFEEMKSKLQQLYDANKDLKEEDYTAQSWKVFKAALDAAKEALSSQEVTTAELKEAYDALEKAVSGLKGYGVLDNLIKQAEAVKQGEYSANSYARLASALENAKNVDRNNQEAVIEAEKNLKDAIDGLVRTVEALNALDEAKKIVQGDFTKDSFTALQNAIKEVENLIKNSLELTQSQLNASVERLVSAQKALVKKVQSAVIEQLKTIYEAYNGQDSVYTSNSFSTMKQVLASIEVAMADISNVSETEGNELLKQAKQAESQLVKRADKTKLREAYERAKTLPHNQYTDVSIKKLKDLFPQIDVALADMDIDQKSVDKIYKNLEDAINGLVKIVEAQSALTEAKKVVQGNYTKDSYTTLQNAIKEVENLIANSADLTQAKLDAAVVRMTAAQKSLVKVVQKNVVDSLRIIYNAYNGKDAAYTSNSFAAMKQVLARIEKVLADTSNVSEKEGSDLLVQAKAAESQLVKRADKTKLNSAYQSAKAISFSRYTDKTVKAVKDLFSQIDAVMANANADQKTVDALYNKLNQAVKGLVKKSITSVKLNVKKKTLGEKEKFKLTVKLKPSGVSAGTLKWSSSNKKIVTVDKKGRITAKKPGTAKITVKTANKKSASCTITVRKKPKSVTLTAKSDRLKVNKTMQLKAKLSKGSAGKVTYTSNKPKIATVSASGKVKALKKGTVTITVKTYNNKKDHVTIKIVK